MPKNKSKKKKGERRALAPSASRLMMALSMCPELQLWKASQTPRAASIGPGTATDRRIGAAERVQQAGDRGGSRPNNTKALSGTLEPRPSNKQNTKKAPLELRESWDVRQFTIFIHPLIYPHSKRTFVLELHALQALV